MPQDDKKSLVPLVDKKFLSYIKYKSAKMREKKGFFCMKILDYVKNEKVLCFVGGVFAATYGVKALKSDKTRRVCVSGLAKCIKLQNEAQEAFKNMKEEAEDICCDAKKAAENE